MKLLILAQAGKFDDGTCLTERHCQFLTTAALHICRASYVGRPSKSRAIDHLRELEDIARYPFGSLSSVTQERDPKTDWKTPMHVGLMHINAVASELQRDGAPSHCFETLQTIFNTTIALYTTNLRVHASEDESPRYGHMFLSPRIWINYCLQYGCIQVEDLATVLVYRALMAPDLPEDAQIENEHMLNRAAEKIGLKWDSFEMASALRDLGMRWLERAEFLAESVRSSQTWTDVLMNTCGCHILYWTAKRALRWARSTYQKLGVEVPQDVWKEQQMAEEYINDTGIFLSMYCSNTLFWPIDAYIGRNITKINRRTLDASEIKAEFVNAVYSYAARTPHYPKLLLQAWRRVAENIRSEQDISRATLEPIIHKEFMSAFADKVVMRTTLQLASAFEAGLHARQSGVQHE